jgi:hypothetical protein
MATPITIKSDKMPATTNPAAHKQTRNAQCNRGDSDKSSCSGEESLLFLGMLEAGKTADRVIKKGGQMTEFECCAKQPEWQEL